MNNIKIPDLKNGPGRCEITGCNERMFAYLNGLWVCSQCLNKYYNKTKKQQEEHAQKLLEETRAMLEN